MKPLKYGYLKNVYLVLFFFFFLSWVEGEGKELGNNINTRLLTSEVAYISLSKASISYIIYFEYQEVKCERNKTIIHYLSFFFFFLNFSSYILKMLSTITLCKLFLISLITTTYAATTYYNVTLPKGATVLDTENDI